MIAKVAIGMTEVHAPDFKSLAVVGQVLVLNGDELAVLDDVFVNRQLTQRCSQICNLAGSPKPRERDTAPLPM